MSPVALSDRVANFLQQPEGLETEFKLNVRALRPEDITAFANARGGTILIGVQERKRVSGETYGVPVGVRGSADSIRAVQDLVTSCNPKLDVKVEEERTDDGLSVIVVDIPEGPAKPYWTSAGLYVIRRSGRKDAIDPLMMRDFLAGAQDVKEVGIPCLLISNDAEGTIPSSLFLGYRVLMTAHFFWQALAKQNPDALAPLRDQTQRVGERQTLVGATIEAAIISWLSQLPGLHFYFDGRPSPLTPRLLVDPAVPKRIASLAELSDIIAGNPFLNAMNEQGSGAPYLQPIILPQGFDLHVERFSPLDHGGLCSRIEIQGNDGNLSFTIYLGGGFRGVPANTPQSVQLPDEEARKYWLDQISIVYRTSFPRASRDQPLIDAYRHWASDLLVNFKLTFDWAEYERGLPDKEVIRTQLMLQEVLRTLERHLGDHQGNVSEPTG